MCPFQLTDLEFDMAHKTVAHHYESNKEKDYVYNIQLVNNITGTDIS